MKKLMIGILLLAATAANGEPAGPYEGQDQREIKALSAADIDGYLSGGGMGFALAAELNHYPGPKHVLDLADEMGLTRDQRRLSNAIKIKVLAAARTLGKQLVDKERELDAAFASGEITGEQMAQLVGEISSIQGNLRAVHLKAHIDQRSILTHAQIQIYDQHRGYQIDPRHDHSHHDGHDHE